MNRYRVTLLHQVDASSLYLLCAIEAVRLMETCEFKQRKEGDLDRVTMLLLRQCKAYMIGYLEPHELYVDLPDYLLSPIYNFTEWETHQMMHICESGKGIVSMPSFNVGGLMTPAKDVIALLHYENLNKEEVCQMYDDILYPKGRKNHVVKDS